jgi:predicted nucleotidyltransferase
MDRDNILAKLRAHEQELKHAGIVRLSLFGSAARGDARPDSDVDLLAAFEARRRISLLDVVHIQMRLPICSVARSTWLKKGRSSRVSRKVLRLRHCVPSSDPS